MAKVKLAHMATAALALLAVPAWADPVADAMDRRLLEARASVAAEVHLHAFDLIDELVLGWKDEPVFAAPTGVVLADMGVPVGLGVGMQALLENHLGEVLGANPDTQLQLVHCPACTSVVVHSGPEATVVSRGMDQPDALEQLEGASLQSQHALYIDVEAQGAFLVLRARLTRLTPERPVVWSRTLASSTSLPSMLRAPDALTSADEARQAYLDLLEGRGSVHVPLRVGVRTYALPYDPTGLAPPPFLWVQSGVEVDLRRGGRWTGSMLGGFSFIPDAYMGIMGQARVGYLMTGRVRSMSRPDLYGFVGVSAISVWGPGTESFGSTTLTADDVLTAQDEGIVNRDTFGTIHAGVDLRVGRRIGLSFFYEHMPSMRDNPNMGSYVTILNVPFQSLGTEVTLWF